MMKTTAGNPLHMPTVNVAANQPARNPSLAEPRFAGPEPPSFVITRNEIFMAQVLEMLRQGLAQLEPKDVRILSDRKAELTLSGKSYVLTRNLFSANRVPSSWELVSKETVATREKPSKTMLGWLNVRREKADDKPQVEITYQRSFHDKKGFTRPYFSYQNRATGQHYQKDLEPIRPYRYTAKQQSVLDPQKRYVGTASPEDSLFRLLDERVFSVENLERSLGLPPTL